MGGPFIERRHTITHTPHLHPSPEYHWSEPWAGPERSVTGRRGFVQVIAEMCDNRDAGCRCRRSGEEVEAVAAGGVFRKIGGPSFGLRDTGNRRNAPPPSPRRLDPPPLVVRESPGCGARRGGPRWCTSSTTAPSPRGQASESTQERGGG